MKDTAQQNTSESHSHRHQTSVIKKSESLSALLYNTAFALLSAAVAGSSGVLVSCGLNFRFNMTRRGLGPWRGDDGQTWGRHSPAAFRDLEGSTEGWNFRCNVVKCHPRAPSGDSWGSIHHTVQWCSGQVILIHSYINLVMEGLKPNPLRLQSKGKLCSSGAQAKSPKLVFVPKIMQITQTQLLWWRNRVPLKASRWDSKKFFAFYIMFPL